MVSHPSTHHTPTLAAFRCAAASRFSRDRITDLELSKLLRWWQRNERSAAEPDHKLAGLVDEKEALLQARDHALNVITKGCC